MINALDCRALYCTKEYSAECLSSNYFILGIETDFELIKKALKEKHKSLEEWKVRYLKILSPFCHS